MQEEAVMNARRVTFGDNRTPVFTAEHLAAELLRSGRPKDLVRVIDLMKSDQFDAALFQDVVQRHGLSAKWKEFVVRFDLEA